MLGKVLDHMEGMLDPRPHLRLGLLVALRKFLHPAFRQCPDVAAFLRQMPLDRGALRGDLFTLLHPEIPRVEIDFLCSHHDTR
jgi:hypothetical protein